MLFGNKHCYDIVVHHHRKQCVMKPASTPQYETREHTAVYEELLLQKHVAVTVLVTAQE